jgi:hypothetical protein
MPRKSGKFKIKRDGKGFSLFRGRTKLGKWKSLWEARNAAEGFVREPLPIIPTDYHPSGGKGLGRQRS